MKRFAIALSVAAGFGTLGLPVIAGGDEETKASIAWVNNLADECARLDAYQCDTREEDNFLSRDADEAMVPGAMLRAWQASLTDFMANPDLSTAAKDLKHYKFGFSQDADNYIVLYRALLLPRVEDNSVSGILQSSVGQTTKYWIDKSTGAVTKRLYLR